MKKVIAVSGIRSEFDILSPVLKALIEVGFDVGVVVSGANLSDWHGNFIDYITSSGFRIVEKVDSLFMTNRKIQQVKGIGALLFGLSQAIERENPDLLLVVGDREESIATAICGNYMDVPVAHIAGGDPQYGHHDSSIRHSVSKLSHINFTFTKKHSEILEKMGEEKFRIFTTGNPALDNIREVKNKSLEEISNELEFSLVDKNYVVFIQHPDYTEKKDFYQQMQTSLKALEELGEEKGLKTIAVYPNTDPGSYNILEAINEYKKSKHIKFFKTFFRDTFVNLMRNTLALVGNSSMGILESPFYKIPVVDIGQRQQGKITCGNVRNVNFDKDRIKKEVLIACYENEYRNRVKKIKNIYGDGFSGKRIAKILNEIDLTDKRKWLSKRLNYFK